jgi:hypothetical protein
MHRLAVCLALALGASLPARADQATSHLEVQPARPAALHIVHACTGEARPDRVVIVGGMSAEAIRPTEAQARLDRQLAELRKLAAAHGGEVLALERLRAARTARERQDSRPEPPPFVMLQRLEVSLPAKVDVDAIFERALALGLDRFGSGIRVEHVETNPRLVVRYRFSALGRELDALHERCRAAAIAHWCAAPQAEGALCRLPPSERASRFVTQQLSVQTQSLLMEHGGVTRYQFALPWTPDQLSRVEPLGDLPVRFEGTLRLAVVDVPR